MRHRIEQRQVEFRATPGGALERAVTLPDGRAYAHRCAPDVFEAVAGHLADHPGDAAQTQPVAEAVGAPMTQVNVALQLLAERGLLARDGRVAPGYVDGFYEHALTEFYALIEAFKAEEA